MSFEQGLSGLNGASKTLEVIGNNIANSNTVGFKSSQAQFADVYANSLSGAGGGGTVGIGTKLAQVAQQFSQGNVSASTNPLDLAINGGGFFRMSNNGTISYARNGQFQLDKNGFIVNATGSQLTGFTANSKGVLATGAPVPINIIATDLPPVQTGKVSCQLNLDSSSTIPAVQPFDSTDATTYNNSTSVNIYDSLGNSHVLQTFFVKTAAVNTWDLYASVDGTEISKATAGNAATTSLAGVAAPPAVTAAEATTAADAALAAMTAAGIPTPALAAAPLAALKLAMETAGVTARGLPGATPVTVAAAIVAATPSFSNGTLTFSAGGIISAPIPSSFPFAVPVTSGATTPFTVNYDLTGTTQFGGAFSVKSLDQDGYTSGRLSGFNTSNDGTITGRYTNGKSSILGQVVLSNFRNPNGLQALGGNAWAETSDSGVPLVGTPTTGNLGAVQSSSVEDSNVDLTAELVNMITAQRVYQANAQTIKTQDQVLQTLVNLR